MTDVVTQSVSLKTRKAKVLDFSLLAKFLEEKVGKEDVFNKTIVLRESDTTLAAIWNDEVTGGNGVGKSGTAVAIDFAALVSKLEATYLPQEKRSTRAEVKLKKIVAVLKRVAKKFAADGSVLVYVA